MSARWSSYPPPGQAGLSTQSIAIMLSVASLGELLILRIGTRTAIHIPDIEAVYTPFRLVATTGRLAFSIAVVLLAVLLGRLIVELHRNDATTAAIGVGTFVGAAVFGRLGLIDTDIVTVVTIAVVVLGAALGWFRRADAIAAALLLFAVAYTLAGLATVLPNLSVSAVATLTGRAEQLAVLIAITSGPAVRHALGRPLVASRRLNLWAAAFGIVVAGAIVANPSTTHILMLWNFGLTGAMPAVFYGLAAASLTIAIASAHRHHGASLAAGLGFVALGGLGLISTYQSGLTVAGLALCTLSATPRQPLPGAGAERPAADDRRAIGRRRLEASGSTER